MHLWLFTVAMETPFFSTIFFAVIVSFHLLSSSLEGTSSSPGSVPQDHGIEDPVWGPPRGRVILHRHQIATSGYLLFQKNILPKCLN